MYNIFENLKDVKFIEPKNLRQSKSFDTLLKFICSLRKIEIPDERHIKFFDEKTISYMALELSYFDKRKKAYKFADKMVSLARDIYERSKRSDLDPWTLYIVGTFVRTALCDEVQNHLGKQGFKKDE